MNSSFDPKINKNPKLIDSIILSKNGNTLVQSPKKNYKGFLGFIKKVIHWIRHPNERIACVRDLFNAQLSQMKEFSPLKEEATLLANCSYFNQRVIKKHNDSWISFFLFWNRVPLIDAKRLEALRVGFKSKLDAVQKDLNKVHVAESLTASAARYNNHAMLLNYTEALDAFPEFAEVRSQIKLLQSGLQKSIVERFKQDLERISSLSQLQEEDLHFFQEFEDIKDLLDVNDISQIKPLIEEKNRVQKELENLQKQLKDYNNNLDLSQNVQDLKKSKCISLESKQELDELLAVHKWESEVTTLRAKTSQTQDFAALRKEYDQLQQAKPPRAICDRLHAVGRIIDLQERIEKASRSLQAHVSGVPILPEMKAQYQELLSADLSKNPHVASIQAAAQKAFVNLEKNAEECAFWKAQFVRLQKDNADLVSNQLDRLARGALHLRLNPKQAEIEEFLSKLPDSPAKAELVAAKQAYEENLHVVQELVASAKRIFYAFYNIVRQDKYIITSWGFLKLEAIAAGYPEPEIQTLLDTYRKDFKKKVEVLVDEIKEIKKALNAAVPETMALVLAAIADVLGNDIKIFDYLEAAEKEAVLKYLKQLLMVQQHYSGFKQECELYSKLTASPEEATTAMDISQRALPELVKHLDNNNALLAQFYQQRWLYHMNSIYLALQQTNGSDLAAIESALQAILSEINQTQFNIRVTDCYQIEAKCKQQIALLRTMQNTHAEWLEFSKRFTSSSDAKALSQALQTLLTNKGIDNIPLVRTVTTLAREVIAKFTAYEEKIAYYRAYFERMTKQNLEKAETAPQDMVETYPERPAFDTFMTELPDGGKKNDLQQRCKEFEQFLLRCQKFKKNLEPILALYKKISAEDYIPTKEDSQAVFNAYGAVVPGNQFSSAYEDHQIKLKDLFDTCFQKCWTKWYEQIKYYENPSEPLFELTTEQDLNEITTDLQRLKEFVSINKFIDTLNQLINSTNKMKRMVSLYATFKAEFKAYEAMPKDGSGDAPTKLTPTDNPPELVTMLGVEHPISQKYITMIQHVHLRRCVVPLLTPLVQEITQVKSDKDIDNLSSRLATLETELDKVTIQHPESDEAVKQSEKARSILNDLRAFQAVLRPDLEKFNKKESLEEVRQAADAIALTCSNSLVKEHPYVKGFAETIETFKQDMNTIEGLLQEIYAFRVNTEAEIEALLPKKDRVNELADKLAQFSDKYPSHAGIALCRRALTKIQNIFTAYPEFKEVRDRFERDSQAAIDALESAADSFGAQAPQYASHTEPAMPKLMKILGPEHAVIAPLMATYKRMNALRTFTQGCIILQRNKDAIHGMSESEQASIVETLVFRDNEAPKVKKVAPKLEANYQALTPEMRLILQTQLQSPQAVLLKKSISIMEMLDDTAYRPEENKKLRSLLFFYQDENVTSLYRQVQNLLSDPLLTPSINFVINNLLDKCFPEIVYMKLAFIEKCSKIWKGNTAPNFNEEELDILWKLVAATLPLPLKLQLELLLKMHVHQFHPRNTCPITLGPLLDPVVTVTNPPCYYDRTALEKWLHSKRRDPLTELPMAMHQVKHKPVLGKIVQDWLLCKDLMKRPAGSTQDMFDKLMKHCPEKLRAILLSYKNQRFDGDLCANKYQQIQEKLKTWASQGQQLNYWTKLLAETNYLSWLIADLTNKTSQPGFQYGGFMSPYVTKLFKLAANLEILYPKLSIISALQYHQPATLNHLKENIQLLRYMLNQADAFSEANFTESVALCAKILMRSPLSNLVENLDGFEGSDAFNPQDDLTPPPAFNDLFVRVLACNTRHETRTSQSSDEYKKLIEQMREVQLQSLKNLWISYLSKSQKTMLQQNLEELQALIAAYTNERRVATQRRAQSLKYDS